MTACVLINGLSSDNVLDLDQLAPVPTRNDKKTGGESFFFKVCCLEVKFKYNKM